MKKRSSSVAALLLSSTMLFTGAAQAGAGVANSSFGNSYGDWGVRWWEWMFSIPANQSPNLTSGSVDCSIGQAGNVWFLGGTFGGAATRSCSAAIPAGKALFFPLVNVVVNRPKALETLTSLRRQADAFIGTVAVTSLYCNVDGVPCADANGAALAPFRATSPSFSILPLAQNGLVPPGKAAGPGANDAMVSDGYWMLLKPLTPGNHTITFGGAWTGGAVSVTYFVTAQ